LASLLLDCIVMAPLSALVLWADSRYRLFSLYYLVPGTLIGLFYSVYLVRRFGGTPGKLIMGIRIRKLDGDPVGYREAILRYLPDFVFGVLMTIAMLGPQLRMTDAEYHSHSFMDKARMINELAPGWYKPLRLIQNVWIWGEFLVLLTNKKRRALHDFIAGTVVVHVPPKTLEPAVTAPAVLTGA
jgi:uncharacterized RDD family membrane protein YckC